MIAIRTLVFVSCACSAYMYIFPPAKLHTACTMRAYICIEWGKNQGITRSRNITKNKIEALGHICLKLWQCQLLIRAFRTVTWFTYVGQMANWVVIMIFVEVVIKCQVISLLYSTFMIVICPKCLKDFPSRPNAVAPFISYLCCAFLRFFLLLWYFGRVA